MKIKKNLVKVFPIMILSGCYWVLGSSIFLGYWTKTWRVTLDFNIFGEAYIELFLVIISLPFVVWYFYQDISSWELNALPKPRKSVKHIGFWTKHLQPRTKNLEKLNSSEKQNLRPGK